MISEKRKTMTISLRAARVLTGYSAKEAAELISVSEGTLRKYERNSSTMPLKLAVELMKAYHLPIDAIAFL